MSEKTSIWEWLPLFEEWLEDFKWRFSRTSEALDQELERARTATDDRPWLRRYRR